MKKAFTLVELLIFMGIFSILIFILTDIFVASLNTRLESESTTGVDQDGRYILARLMYDIRRSQAVAQPTSPGNQTLTLQLTINGDTHTYTLNSGNFELTNNLGTERLNSMYTRISGLTFTRLGNLNPNADHTIQIAFTVTSITVINNQPEVKNFQTTVGLR